MASLAEAVLRGTSNALRIWAPRYAPLWLLELVHADIMRQFPGNPAEAIGNWKNYTVGFIAIIPELYHPERKLTEILEGLVSFTPGLVCGDVKWKRCFKREGFDEEFVVYGGETVGFMFEDFGLTDPGEEGRSS